MRKYQHIFFDLDKTLWDFDANIGQAMLDLLKEFDVDSRLVEPVSWVESYREINQHVWQLFENKELSKAELRLERFRLLLKKFNVYTESLAESMSAYFLQHSPQKGKLMPKTKEVLLYLSENYKLYVLSNGFYDVQQIKLKASGIDGFFDKVFTSDQLMCAKPNRKIFEEAVKSVNAKKTRTLMVGDNFEKDIVGARLFGIDQVWYNAEHLFGDERGATYEITCLSELNLLL